MPSPVAVRPRFLQNHNLKVKGKEARILLFDSGIGAPGKITGRIIDLSKIDGRYGIQTSRNSHGLRVASLAAGHDLGLAPSATILSADYRPSFPFQLPDVVQKIIGQHGVPHIIGFGFSASLKSKINEETSLRWSSMGESAYGGSLCVAPVGHDGPGCIRYPAIVQSFFAVGTCNPDGSANQYSGSLSRFHKPEILVPDGPYETEDESGQKTTIGGTSAAVGIVVGIAALWVERLKSNEIEITPGILKALLIATSQPLSWTDGRILGDCSSALQSSFIAETKVGENLNLSEICVEIVIEGALHVCAFAESGIYSESWRRKGPVVSINLVDWNGNVVKEVEAENWCVMDVSGLSSKQYTMTIRVIGSVAVVSYAVIGALKVSSRVKDVRKKQQIFVGVSASHNASACVIKGDRLECAIQLERITRKKNDGKGFLHSEEAIRYVLSSQGIRPECVDTFAFNIQPIAPAYVGLSQPVASANFRIFDPFAGSSLFVSHHLAHAMAAFATSDFEEATVLVADGAGGITVGADDLLLAGPDLQKYLCQTWNGGSKLHTLSTYLFNRAGYKLIDRVYAPSFNVRCGSSSLGETYAATSQFLFGDWNEGSGKLMGLAPYGEPEMFSQSLLLRESDSGALSFSHEWKMHVIKDNPTKDIMDWKHLAARIQRDLEIALVDWATRSVRRTGSTNVVFTGGLSLNVSANSKLADCEDIQELFILPASNDAGISIGAAASAFWREAGRIPRLDIRNDFLGHEYNDEDCEDAITGFKDVLQISSFNVEDIADRLNAGQIIGWFRGSSEFGPRALGHRSILASPGSKQVSDRINSDVKWRESFRPFAPVVIAEKAAQYFELDRESHYMLRAVNVRKEYRAMLQGVTHVDGTARVQTLQRNIEPILFDLLIAFEKRSGVPILLNTSLNVRSQPLVETPTQAIELFLSTQINALVLGKFLIELRSAQGGILSLNSVLAFAPDVSLVTEKASGGITRRFLVTRNRLCRYELTSEISTALDCLDGVLNIAEVYDSAPQAGYLCDMPIIQALVSERLLLVVAERKQNAKLPIGEKLTDLWEKLTPQYVQPLLGNSLRVRDLNETLSHINTLRSRLGVTRLADVTGFDVLGIPVAIASRPQVSTAQITATQGKGLTIEIAMVSALMEAAERKAANQSQKVLLETMEALQKTNKSVFGPIHFQGNCEADKLIEWCEATDIRSGLLVYVPMSTVMFPYHSIDGTASSPRPCTTGLAAGNSLAEAVLHGLLELAERHSVSIDLSSRTGRLVDLKTLDKESSWIVSRMTERGFCVHITEVTSITGLPSYISRIVPSFGMPPHVVAAGQATDVNKARAIKRSLLEAAQSRVVATLGNREDLIRHAALWEAEHDDAMNSWKKLAYFAESNGTVEASECSSYWETVGDVIEFVIQRINDAGFHSILAIDLTEPSIGIPVVRVLVPGMLDLLSRGGS